MALTDQPYLPLYINDWLSNTKLKQCCANSHGILINIMALMHKQDNYGTILLQQKYKQNDKQILNFATQFARLLSFDLAEIEKGLSELLDEKVLKIVGDVLVNERMVRDAEISKIRASSGSNGGKKTAKNKDKFAVANSTAKKTANPIIINDIEIINKYGQKTITAFQDYWNEKSKSGRCRWELEKVFEISRRLSTWKSNESKFNNGSGNGSYTPPTQGN